MTPCEQAADALSSYGCDCGNDEPGTCLACLCEAAMRAERTRAERAESECETLLNILLRVHSTQLPPDVSGEDR